MLSLMAVVIQEMVSSDFSGVMFTVDPVTGDPTYPYITANFGLGEVCSHISTLIFVFCIDIMYIELKDVMNSDLVKYQTLSTLCILHTSEPKVLWIIRFCRF